MPAGVVVALPEKLAVPVKLGLATGAAPKAVKAAPALVAPVPPLATAKVPVMLAKVVVATQAGAPLDMAKT